MITLFKYIVEKIKKKKVNPLYEESEQDLEDFYDDDPDDIDQCSSSKDLSALSDAAEDSNSLEENLLEPKITLQEDFGNGVYSYPESCTDLTRQRREVRLSYGSYKLTGDAYSDLQNIVRNLQDYSKYACAEETKLLEYELERMVYSLLGDGRPQPTLKPVPAVNYLVNLLENNALKDDVRRLKEEVSTLNHENSHYLDQLNVYRDGAMSGRTAHAICLRSAEDMYGMVTHLIDTHPGYDGEINLTSSKGGKEGSKSARLKEVFGDKRGLAKASATEILSISGIGDATLALIVNMFKDENIPSIAGLGDYGFKQNYGFWQYVHWINSEVNYKWMLPTVVMGGRFHVTRYSCGYSYLIAKDANQT